MTHSAIIRGDRTFAHRLVASAPEGSVIEVKPPRRSLDQNSLLWARLTEISAAKPEGRELTPEVWKALFCHALDHEQRFEQALDGRGFVPLGYRTSRMTKAQMADLLTVIEEYAARHGIEFQDYQPIPQGAGRA